MRKWGKGGDPASVKPSVPAETIPASQKPQGLPTQLPNHPSKQKPQATSNRSVMVGNPTDEGTALAVVPGQGVRTHTEIPGGAPKEPKKETPKDQEEPGKTDVPKGPDLGRRADLRHPVNAFQRQVQQRTNQRFNRGVGGAFRNIALAATAAMGPRGSAERMQDRMIGGQQRRAVGEVAGKDKELAGRAAEEIEHPGIGHEREKQEREDAKGEGGAEDAPGTSEQPAGAEKRPPGFGHLSQEDWAQQGPDIKQRVQEAKQKKDVAKRQRDMKTYFSDWAEKPVEDLRKDIAAKIKEGGGAQTAVDIFVYALPTEKKTLLQQDFMRALSELPYNTRKGLDIPQLFPEAEQASKKETKKSMSSLNKGIKEPEGTGPSDRETTGHSPAEDTIEEDEGENPIVGEGNVVGDLSQAPPTCKSCGEAHDSGKKCMAREAPPVDRESGNTAMKAAPYEKLVGDFGSGHHVERPKNPKDPVTISWKNRERRLRKSDCGCSPEPESGCHCLEQGYCDCPDKDCGCGLPKAKSKAEADSKKKWTGRILKADDEDDDDDEVTCPKCNGRGCSHCNYTGSHLKKAKVAKPVSSEGVDEAHKKGVEDKLLRASSNEGTFKKYITHTGDKYVVHAESGKVLGEHSSGQDAHKQLYAIEQSKERAKKWTSRLEKKSILEEESEAFPQTQSIPKLRPAQAMGEDFREDEVVRSGLATPRATAQSRVGPPVSEAAGPDKKVSNPRHDPTAPELWTQKEGRVIPGHANDPIRGSQDRPLSESQYHRLRLHGTPEGPSPEIVPGAAAMETPGMITPTKGRWPNTLLSAGIPQKAPDSPQRPRHKLSEESVPEQWRRPAPASGEHRLDLQGQFPSIPQPAPAAPKMPAEGTQDQSQERTEMSVREPPSDEAIRARRGRTEAAAERSRSENEIRPGMRQKVPELVQRQPPKHAVPRTTPDLAPRLKQLTALQKVSWLAKGDRMVKQPQGVNGGRLKSGISSQLSVLEKLYRMQQERKQRNGGT